MNRLVVSAALAAVLLVGTPACSPGVRDHIYPSEPMPSAARSPGPSAMMAQFIGTYRPEDGEAAFEIALGGDGGLVLKRPGRPAERLALSPDGLSAGESGLMLRIAQTSPGKVQRLTYGPAGGPTRAAVRIGPDSASGR